jgi:hypothetical protein
LDSNKNEQSAYFEEEKFNMNTHNYLTMNSNPNIEEETGVAIGKRPVKKWEKRWVLQPNVIECGGDIWIPKWICVENVSV